MTYPVETHPVYPTDTIITKPVYVPTGTAPGAPSATTTGVEFTGAASANKMGGALFAVGLAAALL